MRGGTPGHARRAGGVGGPGRSRTPRRSSPAATDNEAAARPVRSGTREESPWPGEARPRIKRGEGGRPGRPGAVQRLRRLGLYGPEVRGNVRGVSARRSLRARFDEKAARSTRPGPGFVGWCVPVRKKAQQTRSESRHMPSTNFRRLRGPLALVGITFPRHGHPRAAGPADRRHARRSDDGPRGRPAARAGHLTKPTINDEVSKKWCRNYLKALDPQKMYFEKADVEAFLTQDTKLDDFVREGPSGAAQAGAAASRAGRGRPRRSRPPTDARRYGCRAGCG